MIYISSIAFAGKTAKEVAELANEHQLPFEFSSGMPYDAQLLHYFSAYPYPKLAHNYFPPPAEPFVLNLASIHAATLQTSIAHCMQGLQISRQANAAFFCAHAGYCLDPKPEELGQQLKQSGEVIDREKHWQIFKKTVLLLLEEADRLGLDFYIENNVTAAMNINSHGQNPLLCSEPKEIVRLFTEINHPRLGLLLDTAHLKVSAGTLAFDLEEAMAQLSPYIRAIHHSDNDGLLDSNQPIYQEYWFAPFMPFYRNLPQVLEVKKQSVAEIHRQVDLLLSFTSTD
jgi:Xylose isomerase-like TIM barrel